MKSKSLLKEFEKSKDFSLVCYALSKIEEWGEEAYLVGGAVRDALLGKASKDLDLATSARVEEMQKIFFKDKLVATGIEFGTLTLVKGAASIEITTYRGDEKYSDGRRPDSLSFSKDKKEDLLRRDFTINAMMFHPTQGLYDPFGGQKDLESKIIKAVGEPEKRILEDHLRILRAFRFSLNLDFEIEEETLKFCRKHFSLLKKISSERVESEVKKMLSKDIYFERLNGILKVFGKKDFNSSFFEGKKRDLVLNSALVALFYKEYLPGLRPKDTFRSKEMLSFLDFYNRDSKRVEEFIAFIDRKEIYAYEACKLYEVLEDFFPLKEKINVAHLEKYNRSFSKKLVQNLQDEFSGKELGEKIKEDKKRFLKI